MDENQKPLGAAFASALERYGIDVAQSNLASADSKFQAVLKQLIVDFRLIWSRFRSSSALSSNDESLDDLSVMTIRFLSAPYFIGDLYQKVLPSGDPSNNTNESTERARTKILAVSEHFFSEFLSIMVTLQLANEREVESQTKYAENSRSSRVSRSREMTELKKKLKELDSRLSYEAAKRSQLRRLAAEDGDEVEDGGDEDEEIVREREITFLKWCILDCVSQLQLSSREMDMLGRLDDNQKRQIVQDYQAGIQLFKEGKNDKGRNTYTILPGGLIAPGFIPLNAAQSFREQVRDEVFMERNRPTMTLDEFAQQEMAEIQRQMDAQAAGEAAQKEEDERLGDEGIEERERVKQARWDDWRDENPPIGITTKGNYS